MTPSSLIEAARRRIARARWRRRVDPGAGSAPETEGLPDGVDPPVVLIRSWNRPLHLWASLDSFYRNTATPARFVLMDNASDDPLVGEIIDGFERRGMFHAVHRLSTNDPANQQTIYDLHRASLGPYIVLADADVVVLPGTVDWLGRLLQVMHERPALGLLGAQVDKGDFISLEAARAVAPEISDDPALRNLVKADSPERHQPDTPTDAVIKPHRPPGRLMLARTEILDQTGARIGNKILCDAVEAAGYEVGIASGVFHRHLSLLNLYAPIYRR